MDDITKIDLYELLDILPSATTKDVKKAYRKKALKCHPDKNPDNPKAAELFHQLSRALEILTDDFARAAYDKVINAKKAAALRNKELDSKRKKLKEDLEARERQSMNETAREKSAEEKLKAEIDRLRKEGSKQLQEEIEIVRKQVQEERFGHQPTEAGDAAQYRLKVSWNIADGQDGYTKESLEKIFSKHGDIAALVVSSKKKGSALLEFCLPSCALRAQKLEKGFMSNPLTISWLSGPPPGVSVPRDSPPVHLDTEPTLPGDNVFPFVPTCQSEVKRTTAFPCFATKPVILTKDRQSKKEEDFESIVLARMRQAQEEKRRAQESGES